MPSGSARIIRLEERLCAGLPMHLKLAAWSPAQLDRLTPAIMETLADGIDIINAGAGNDDLFGGTGSDNLTGGTGTDRFRFDTALSAATNVDHILDFDVVDDTIFLDRNIFTGIAVNGTLAAGAFRAGTSAGDVDDRIVYDAATGNIFYDADGLGGVAQILFATIGAGTALTNADFNADI